MWRKVFLVFRVYCALYIPVFAYLMGSGRVHADWSVVIGLICASLTTGVWMGESGSTSGSVQEATDGDS